MISKRILSLSSALGLGLFPLVAQETTDIEQLQKQLESMQQQFDDTVRQQRQEIDLLKSKIDSLEREKISANADARSTEESRPTGWSPASPLRLGSGRNFIDVGLVGTFAVGGSTADDIEGGTQLGGHDPNQNGFSVQGVEATFSGAVDPYFSSLAAINFGLDSEGESFFELEEAWMETLAMPGNLKLRGGQIYTEFGRHNPTHLHSWDFVDVPLVNGRFFGPDGQRNPGGWLSWLAPTPFFSEFLVSVQDSQGETAWSFRRPGEGEGDHSHGGGSEVPFAYRHPDNDRGLNHMDDLLITPRIVTSFDIADSQTILLGGSAAFGPNNIGGEDAGDTRTQIYGVDLTWKWKPANQSKGFPFLAWQTEGMLRRTEVGMFDWDEDGDGLVSEGEVEDLDTGAPAVLGRETLTDYGFYTQVIYGFTQGWTAGLRYDWLDGDTGDYERRNLAFEGEALAGDPLRSSRWRLSPNLTWYPSEFSKIRLQYNLDDRRRMGTDHSVWMQFEFSLGAHAAHTF